MRLGRVAAAGASAILLHKKTGYLTHYGGANRYVQPRTAISQGAKETALAHSQGKEGRKEGEEACW